MRMIIVGLGSMGTRRIRVLRRLGITEISGVEVNQSRAQDVSKEYRLPVYSDLSEALRAEKPGLALVCTDPDSHYANCATLLKAGISTFVEAGVDGSQYSSLARISRQSGAQLYPSCTPLYFSWVQRVRKALGEGQIGTPLVATYHVGQHLDDWHPWERPADYYVSKLDTGGCRELVPFELNWLIHLFGTPTVVSSVVSRTGVFDLPINDVYQVSLRFDQNNEHNWSKPLLVQLTIEILSRPMAIRRLVIIGTDGLIKMEDPSRGILVANSTNSVEMMPHDEEADFVKAGYINSDLAYQEEISDMLSAERFRRRDLYPHDLSKDHLALSLLQEIEEKAERV